MKRNYLYKKNCIEVMEDFKECSIDLIVTDPPYLINYKTGYRKNKNHKFCSTINNDDNFILIEKYIKECYRILKDNSAMYIFCSQQQEDFFKKCLKDSRFTIKNMIIWVKNNWTAGDLKCSYGKQYEIIYYVNKGKKEINGKRLSDVWNFPRVSGNSQLHSNQKPVSLIKRCIEKSSNIKDLVFDGFAGSGTTGEASKLLDRDFILCENDPYYINIIEKRLNKNINIDKSVISKNKIF
jgi:site-specific DNA-methyltransferase (adenine-specific)